MPYTVVLEQGNVIFQPDPFIGTETLRIRKRTQDTLDERYVQEESKDQRCRDRHPIIGAVQPRLPALPSFFGGYGTRT